VKFQRSRNYIWTANETSLATLASTGILQRCGGESVDSQGGFRELDEGGGEPSLHQPPQQLHHHHHDREQ